MSQKSYFRMRCPHCEWDVNVRDSRQITPLVRQITFACKNNDCGHIFIGLLEAITTLSPSAIPSPDIHLPLSPNIRSDVIRKQLDMFDKQKGNSA